MTKIAISKSSNIRNAARIILEFQQLAGDDRVWLGPEDYPFYTVATIGHPAPNLGAGYSI